MNTAAPAASARTGNASARIWPVLVVLIVIVFIGSAIQPTTIFADYFEQDCRTAIDKIINTFKTGDKDRLSAMIVFPLERPYPIPPIERDEFVVRYHEVFDDKLVNTIVSSHRSDWSAVGWRGILFRNDIWPNGVLWINYDGTIRHVNYISSFETAEQKRLLQLRDVLREREPGRLHYSLQEYSYPILDWKTDTYRIRIDQISEYEYLSFGLLGAYRADVRYAAWKADAPHDAIPDIVLDGIEIRIGCCGTLGGRKEVYSFKNGEYLYEVKSNQCHGSPWRDHGTFNLRVWRSPGQRAVIPTPNAGRTGCFLEADEYNALYNYELLLSESFVETKNAIDRALYDDYRNRYQGQPGS